MKIENRRPPLQWRFSIRWLSLNCIIASALLLLFQAATIAGQAEPNRAFEFDDFPLQEPLDHPDWFKHSFLDLQEDLREALAADKAGIIVYFGQQRCAYCKQFFDTSLNDIDTQNYLRKHYDIVALDIWSSEDIIDTDGKKSACAHQSPR